MRDQIVHLQPPRGERADATERLLQAPWRGEFRPTCILVGGSIARAWSYFGPALEAGGAVAAQLDHSALLGAAVEVVRSKA